MATANHKFKQQLEFVCEKYADKAAVTYMRNGGTKTDFTFKQIFGQIQNARKQFESVGLRPGDRVAVISPHSPFAVVAMFALAYSNITSVLIDATLPAEEINRLLNVADVRAVFTVPGVFEKLTAALVEDIPVFNLSVEQDAYVIFENSSSKVTRAATVDLDLDVITILFSSGTTASMKGIMIKYTAVELSRPMYHKITGSTDNMTLLFALPYNHVAGCFCAFQHFLSGCGLGMIEDIDAVKLQGAFQEYLPDLFAIVPKFFEVVEQKIRQEVQHKGIVVEKIFNGLLAMSGFSRKYFGINIGKVLFKGIRKKVFGKNIYGLGVGGAVCNKSTAKFFLNLGITLWANFYALTETYVPAVTTGIFDRYPAGTEGKINRFDCIDIKIHDPNESGIGEVFIKTALIMKGYFRDPELTEAAFDKYGYFKTGDLGYVDKKGYLHIMGRIKEAIHLHTGKKIAPTDIENLYGGILPDITLAACGVPSISNTEFDDIHIFIESGSMTADRQSEVKTTIADSSNKISTLYKISGVHFIDKLPTTSIGKVKRYQLKELAIAEREGKSATTEATPKISGDKTAVICRIVSELADSQPVTLESNLKDGLGLDSLNMLELCVALEGEFNISIDESIVKVETVQDLFDLVNSGGNGQVAMPYNIEDYPLAKKKWHILIFRFLMGVSRLFWRFEVSGIENIPKGGKYILAPNHQSYLDSLCIWAAIGSKRVNLNKICCLAAEVFLKLKFGLAMFGGIPVERQGNTIPAMKRGLACMQDGYVMLVHPEGTRSRDGKIHEFKGGAAKLAIDANVPIIPVRINGAWDIFPPHKKLPKFFCLKRLSRYPIIISFGKPIAPEGKTVEMLIEETESAVKRLGADGGTSGQDVPKLQGGQEHEYRY